MDYKNVDPIRFESIYEPVAQSILLVGVTPGFLFADRSIEVALVIRAILLAKSIEDVHVEICTSIITTFAKMYKPALSSNSTVQVMKLFSTSLSITICAKETSDILSTATLFFTVTSKPGKLLLLATRHGLFQVDENNEHYVYDDKGLHRNVLLLDTKGFEARLQDIKAKIGGSQLTKKQLKRRLKLAESLDDVNEAQTKRDDVHADMAKQDKVITQLKQDTQTLMVGILLNHRYFASDHVAVMDPLLCQSHGN